MRDTKAYWQKILAQGFSSSTELLNFLQLPVSLGSRQAEIQFKTRVPRGFAALMDVGNRRDPLLLQVLAAEDELDVYDDFTSDPLQERAANPLKGLIHKYHGRVVLTLTGVCAINCRYCFRRHFPYQDNNPGRHGWQAVLDYIRADDSIHEVILSGGDPLLATDTVLAELFAQLHTIAHVRTLRIHTRVPVVLPERVDRSLLTILAETPLQKVVVLHSNHANELDSRVKNACTALRDTGHCQLLNQSVLLAGVNNDADVLVELSNRLFACGVLPYYLHLLDKVQGSAHFDVAHDEALTIFKKMQALLPGYLVPRLAREVAGEKNKSLVFC